jgi:hypothetical protein
LIPLQIPIRRRQYFEEEANNFVIANDRRISKRDWNQTADTAHAFCAPSQNMDAHPENYLYCQALSNSAVAKFVLFAATDLSRNVQVVQRPDSRR